MSENKDIPSGALEVMVIFPPLHAESPARAFRIMPQEVLHLTVCLASLAHTTSPLCCLLPGLSPASLLRPGSL